MDSKNRLGHIIQSLVEYRKLWLLPAIAGLVLSTFYAFFIQGETWTSRQSMIIRDDLLGQTFKPGSHVSQEALNSALETVLETARRPEVIRKALKTLGPDRSSFLGLVGGNSNWPSDQDVADFRESVSFESANGGEFGKSEVVVLAAKGSSPQRSVEFLSILTDEVDIKLSEVQGDRFESMESELRAALDSTKRSRETLESDLMKMESEFEGNDIHLVRSLNERVSGGSPSAFENKLNEISSLRSNAVRQLAALQSNRKLLVDASKNSVNELPTSAELLASQPSLSEMITGLAKAKQHLAEVASMRQPNHPMVKSGRAGVASIKDQIRRSIGTVVRGLDSQIAAQENEISIIDEMKEKETRKLVKISRKRAPYATLSREVEMLNKDYSEASARLTRMESRKMASASINLLTRIGEPWIGTRADGMGKRTLALIGGIAGLFIGLGLVMMVAPPFVDPQLRTNHASATAPTEEEAVMQQLSEIIPGHETATQHQESSLSEPTPTLEPTYESEPTLEPTYESEPTLEPTYESEPSLEEEAAYESEIIVEREVVSQTQAPPQPEPQLEPQLEPQPVSAQPASAEYQAESYYPTPDPVEVPAVEEGASAFVQPSASTLSSLINSIPETTVQASQPDAEPQSQSPVGQQQALEPQSPSIVVLPNTETTDLQRPATIVPSHQAQVQPQQPVASETDARQTPAKRPGAKTLAAIFANMPQPKTDLAEPATDEPEPEPVQESNTDNEIADRISELTSESNSDYSQARTEAPTERQESQTIQLDGDLARSAIPLQRRPSTRPADLAKADDDVIEQQSIDNVFSQLIPPTQLPRVATDSDVSG